MPPRLEALRALDEAINVLVMGAPFDGLAQRKLKAMIEHALEQVDLIVEVKRVRKAKGAPVNDLTGERA